MCKIYLYVSSSRDEFLFSKTFVIVFINKICTLQFEVSPQDFVSKNRYCKWICMYEDHKERQVKVLLTVDSATTALQNGACTYRCISKQMHQKTPFSHNCYMKSLEFYENYFTLFCHEKNKLFDNIIFTQNHAWHITQSG